MVRHNLLCHCEACYAELVLYIGYTLETEVFRCLKGVCSHMAGKEDCLLKKSTTEELSSNLRSSKKSVFSSSESIIMASFIRVNAATIPSDSVNAQHAERYLRSTHSLTSYLKKSSSSLTPHENADIFFIVCVSHKPYLNVSIRVSGFCHRSWLLCVW